VTAPENAPETDPENEPQNTRESAAIVFDIDGTLVDSTYHHAIAWQRAFDRNDVTIPLWRIHRTVGMGGDKLVAAVAGEDVEERLGDTLRDEWKEEYEKIKPEVFPLPGAAELVRRLSSDGYQVALASSGDPAFAEEALDDLDIRDLVAVLKSAGDVDASKPEPDLVEVTLEAVGRAAVMVGDTPYDVESAQRAGLKCIAVRSGGYGQAELEEAGAALVVDGVEDLIDLDWSKYLPH